MNPSNLLFREMLKNLFIQNNFQKFPGANFPRPVFLFCLCSFLPPPSDPCLGHLPGLFGTDGSRLPASPLMPPSLCDFPPTLRAALQRASQALKKLCKSFIHSGYFYSASSNPLLLRGASNYRIDTVSEFHTEALQATANEGFAEGQYVAARAGFKPATLKTNGAESINKPQRHTR